MPPSPFGTILTHLTPRPRGGKIARITISRPSKLNSLNSPLITQFQQTLDKIWVQNQSDLLGIVLTGDGPKSFIGGADILEMGKLKDPAEARGFIMGIHKACQKIRQIPVPVIARVNGYALGGGLEVAAACDMRVAVRREGVFGMPEVKVGVPSVAEAALLPNLIGWGRTRQLLLLGQNISSDEALKWGLVERVVEEEELDEAVEEWVCELEKNGPLAVRSQKELIRKWEDEPSLEKRIQMSVTAFGEAFRKGNDGTSEPERLMGEFARRKAKI